MRILHIVHSLTLGGAARTFIATAKYSMSATGHEHRLACLNLRHTDPQAILFAEAQGLKIPPVRKRSDLLEEIAAADIVQINWWQHPEMDEFLRSELPPMRLMGWLHVAGDHPPQYITKELVDFLDLAVGGSSYTGLAPEFFALDEKERRRKTTFVVGGADFARLGNVTAKAHAGFNIGYIGTVSPIKMYPRFVPLHQGLRIPDAKIIVCGGDRHPIFRDEAKAAGMAHLFDFRGYVEDINSVLEILDAYGYPLCEDTYAASELNLQEAMYAGIPPVVFPHGGIKTLVVNEYSGLVVHSEPEYREALENLATDRALRERIGRNAKIFAQDMFGAERNAPKLTTCYERLLCQPKRKRTYASPKNSGDYRTVGTERFLESLGGTHPEYEKSYSSTKLDEILAAENEIMRASPLMTLAGLMPYQGHYKSEGYLKLWAGLAQFGQKDFSEAGRLFLLAQQMGLDPFPWRVFWYIALCGVAFGELELAEVSLGRVLSEAPDFEPAKRLQAEFVLGNVMAKRTVLLAELAAL